MGDDAAGANRLKALRGQFQEKFAVFPNLPKAMPGS
jgi:hypothetical protein